MLLGLVKHLLLSLFKSFQAQKEFFNAVDLDWVQVLLVRILSQSALHQLLINWTRKASTRVYNRLILCKVLDVLIFSRVIGIRGISVQQDRFEHVVECLRAANFAKMRKN